jgi:hypothetical protein
VVAAVDTLLMLQKPVQTAVAVAVDGEQSGVPVDIAITSLLSVTPATVAEIVQSVETFQVFPLT